MTIININHRKAPSILSITLCALLLSTSACSNQSAVNTNADLAKYQESTTSAADVQADANKPRFTKNSIATFDEPWAMTALPSSQSKPPVLLVTQKTGELLIVDTATGEKATVSGVPKVAYGGQGGLGDVITAPDFATSNIIYISYVEADSDNNTFGAKVIKAKLAGLNSNHPSLKAITPIWQQTPKVSGQGHYSHRLLFSPDGTHLYISSGDRQKKSPAQDMSVNLGKIIRLNPDGSIPADNAFVSDDMNDGITNSLAAQFWSIGHRNILGMTFDDTGKLWAHEMGPRGGDELNIIKKSQNYGWPTVSNGRNYSGVDIPDHDTRPEFTAPKITWTPVISPSSISIYAAAKHNHFPAWQGQALISGLSSQALVVVDLDVDNAGQTPTERYRYDMGARIRGVQSVDGAVFVLEDGDNANLWQLLPN